MTSFSRSALLSSLDCIGSVSGNLFICLGQQRWFLLRHSHIRNANRDSALCGIHKSETLDLIQHRSRFGRIIPLEERSMILTAAFIDGKLNFQIKAMLFISAVYIPQILRNALVEDDTAHRSIDGFRDAFTINSPEWRTLTLACNATYPS